VSEIHELELLVDEFAGAMKARLRWADGEGHGGWSMNLDEDPKDFQNRLLRNAAQGIHGNLKSLVDAANLSMMIYMNEVQKEVDKTPIKKYYMLSVSATKTDFRCHRFIVSSWYNEVDTCKCIAKHSSFREEFLGRLKCEKVSESMLDGEFFHFEIPNDIMSLINNLIGKGFRV